MTISSWALVNTLEDEETTPGGTLGAAGEGGEKHEESFSLAVPPTVTIPPRDKHIFTKGAEFEHWDAYNNLLFSTVIPLEIW